MREMAEFRVDEEFASELFRDNEGEKLGSVRKILVPTTDPRFPEIGRLQKSLKQTTNHPFFYGWDIRRSYNKQELDMAPMFHLIHTAYFEPSGEECGTEYDDTYACRRCSSGARQESDLFLDWKRIPKKKDIAVTIAGEIVVSRRVVDLFLNDIEGADFLPVKQKHEPDSESTEWYQLSVKSVGAEIIPPTLVGNNLFDYDEEGQNRCPNGDLLGLNLLTEVSIGLDSYNGADIVSSKQFIGVRRGLLRPRRLIFISRKLWSVIERERVKGERVKGVRFEIAHLI